MDQKKYEEMVSKEGLRSKPFAPRNPFPEAMRKMKPPEPPPSPPSHPFKPFDSFGYMFPDAIQEIEKVMIKGEEKYGKHEPWKEIDAKDHLKHATDHIEGFLEKENLEDISHATTRLFLALQVYLKKRH